MVHDEEAPLRVMEELEAVVSANLRRATRLRQSVLQKALSDQLIGNEGSPVFVLPVAIWSGLKDD